MASTFQTPVEGILGAFTVHAQVCRLQNLGLDREVSVDFKFRLAGVPVTAMIRDWSLAVSLRDEILESLELLAYLRDLPDSRPSA